MQIELQRTDADFRMEARNEHGNTVTLDASPAVGGHNSGMRPMQMLLASLGGCSSIDIVSILRKQRQPIEDLRVTIDAEREEDKMPALFTKIHLTYHLRGALDKQKIQKALDLSLQQYCSVAKIVEKTAEITYSYTLNDELSA